MQTRLGFSNPRYKPSFSLRDRKYKAMFRISSVLSPLQSSTDVMFSVAVENTDCFDSGVVCRKSLHINVGRSSIVFDDDSGEPVSCFYFFNLRCLIMFLAESFSTGSFCPQNLSSMVDRKQQVFIWPAGLFTVVHFPAEDITLLWDKKTTIHIQVGPVWQVSASAAASPPKPNIEPLLRNV